MKNDGKNTQIGTNGVRISKHNSLLQFSSRHALKTRATNVRVGGKTAFNEIGVNTVYKFKQLKPLFDINTLKISAMTL